MMKIRHGWWLALMVPVTVAAAQPAADGERPVRELADQVALAQSGAPYLLLETSVPRLRLMSGGAVLRDYEVLQLDAGTPSLAFVTRARPPEFLDPPRRLVEIDPQRTIWREERVAPTVVVEGEVEMEIPPDPFEVPTPERFFLRFEDGVTLEVRQAEVEPGSWERFRWRLADLFDALRPAPTQRLRVVLPAVEAGAFYRAVPAEASLLVSR